MLVSFEDGIREKKVLLQTEQLKDVSVVQRGDDDILGLSGKPRRMRRIWGGGGSTEE